MLLSICFPVLNEAGYIDSLIGSVINSAPLDKEIILIDGGSTDGTIEKINAWSQKNKNIILIQNEERYVSHGFNQALAVAQGRYISLMGAHAEYGENFFTAGLSALEKGVCDAVGGPLIQKGKTSKGKAIARCMSSKFGVGDTEFRTSKKKQYVDSVAFAIYDRKIFERVGGLDIELIRNQDDEFHYRLNKAGFKILMIPEMECVYYVRENLNKLFQQYFQYGLYKPLVIKKINGMFRLRHFIPALFVCYLCISLVFLWFSSWILLPLLLYIILAIIFSFKVQNKTTDVLYSVLVFFVLHFSYGLGFLLGIKNLNKK